MVDTIEQFYSTIHSQLSRIEVPNSVTCPAGNIFSDKSSITNALHVMFTTLSRCSSSLGRTPVSYMEWINEIRRPVTRRERVLEVVLEAHNKFEEERGKCLEEIAKKLETIREV